MNRNIHPILLCGGAGTRLWPLSRRDYPKQFVRLTGAESLLQGAARRVSGPLFAPPIVVTGHDFRFLVIEQLAGVGVQPQRVLIEPEARNTAPAILAAAFALSQSDPDALMLVAPSDHVIPDTEAFRDAVVKAVPRALAGDLVTFGITPTRAETGYGYLQLAPDAEPRADAPQNLLRFVEKPDATRAAQMIASGDFLWNAGIFLFTARTLIAAFCAHGPAVLIPVEAAVRAACCDLIFMRLDPVAWATAPDISVDYAIMEKASNLAVMPFSAGWSDLGDWDAVWQESGPDARGNVASPHSTAIACADTLLYSTSAGVELVGIGLQDIIAVATPDAVLVAHRSQTQRVKEAVAALQHKGAVQATQFRTAHRPWDENPHGLWAKRIEVAPGTTFNLQPQHHAATHWIILSGVAQMTHRDQVHLLCKNESLYVAAGGLHRLDNPGNVPLILLAVQTEAEGGVTTNHPQSAVG